MRYLNSIVLVAAAVLAACSTSAPSSDGASSTGRGLIQKGAVSTASRGSGGPDRASAVQTLQAAAVQASITGTPARSALVGSAYTFAPLLTGASAESVKYVIANCPSWATFNPASGVLAGTPSAQDVGTYSKIAISAIVDGGRVEPLAPFSIAVTELAAGSATLAWEAPLQKTDGTDLTDLAGIRIRYGTDPDSLDQSVDVKGTSSSTYTVRNLLPGTWYFEIQAYSGSTVGSTSPMMTKEVM